MQPPALSREDTEKLLAALNQHLAQDGLVLKAFDPKRWYLYRLDDSFSHDLPVTTPLSEAGAGNVFPYLPQSSDRYWAQLFNELQMLLHTQPVNQRREAEGLPPVNGLWLWGEGSAASTDLKPVSAVYGGGLSGQVIAKRAGSSWSPKAVFGHIAQSGNVVLILDQLIQPAAAEYPEDWQSALSGLDGVFGELLAEQRAGHCDVTLYDAAGNSWLCQQRGRWPFGGRKSAVWGEFV